jgi:plasmid stability protein
MNQITIRRLDACIIEGLKKRAADAGRSMEEEARNILSATIRDEQLARQREGLEALLATRKKIFGDRVFPDSSGEFGKMRAERTKQIEEWALPQRKRRS